MASNYSDYEEFKAALTRGDFDQFSGYKPQEAQPVAAIQPREVGGFGNAFAQSIGNTAAGFGQFGADYIPGVGRDNALKTWGTKYAEEHPTAIHSLADVKESPWLAAKEAVGGAAGFMVPMLATAPVGGALRLAQGAGKLSALSRGAGTVISKAGPTATAAAPSYGGIREAQIRENPEYEDDWRSKLYALGAAGTVGAIESKFGPQEWALKAMSKEGREALAKKFTAETRLGRMGQGAIRGAAIEGAEELVQNPIEQLASYQNPLTEKSLEETAFGGVMGAIGGGVMGGGINLMSRGQTKEAPPAPTPDKPVADIQPGETGDLFGEGVPQPTEEAPAAVGTTYRKDIEKQLTKAGADIETATMAALSTDDAKGFYDYLRKTGMVRTKAIKQAIEMADMQEQQRVSPDQGMLFTAAGKGFDYTENADQPSLSLAAGTVRDMFDELAGSTLPVEHQQELAAAISAIYRKDMEKQLTAAGADVETATTAALSTDEAKGFYTYLRRTGMSRTEAIKHALARANAQESQVSGDQDMLFTSTGKKFGYPQGAATEEDDAQAPAPKGNKSAAPKAEKAPSAMTKTQRDLSTTIDDDLAAGRISEEQHADLQNDVLLAKGDKVRNNRRAAIAAHAITKEVKPAEPLDEVGQWLANERAAAGDNQQKAEWVAKLEKASRRDQQIVYEAAGFGASGASIPTQEEVGKKYGITKQRVQAILKRHEITAEVIDKTVGQAEGEGLKARADANVGAGAGWRTLLKNEVPFAKWSDDRLSELYVAYGDGKVRLGEKQLSEIQATLTHRETVRAKKGLKADGRQDVKDELSQYEDEQGFDTRGPDEAEVDEATGRKYSVQAKPAPANTVENIVRVLRGAFFSASGMNKVVMVVEDETKVPAGLGGSESVLAGTQGFFDVATGKVVLIAKYIPKGSELAVFLHEVGVHKGMHGLLTGENYQNLVNQIRVWAVDGTGVEGEIARKAMARIKRAEEAEAKAEIAAAEEELGSALPEDSKERIREAARMEQTLREEEMLAYFVEISVAEYGIDPTAARTQPASMREWFRKLWAAFKVAVRRLSMNPEKLDAQNVVDLAYGAAKKELTAAWHGTAADFRNFNHVYMGSGEGAQAYGWGTYLAQKLGIAESYRKQDVKRKQQPAPMDEYPGRDELNAALKADDHLGFGTAGGAKRAILTHSDWQRRWEASPDTVTEVSKWLAWKDKMRGIEGSLMLVDAGVDESELLDWDKPLSEQSDLVKKVLNLQDFSDEHLQSTTGEDYYNAIAYESGAEMASKRLDRRGIKGIKFLDATSRGKKVDKTHNLVIFNDKNLHRVLTRVGGSKAKTKYSIAAQPETAFDGAASMVSKFLGDPWNTFKRFGLGALSLDHLVDVAKDSNPEAKGYQDVMRKMQVSEKQWVYKAAQLENKWADVDEPYKGILHSVMRESTRAGFDPSMGTVPAGAAQVEIQKQYNRLNRAAKDIFAEARDYYKEVRKERQAIMQNALTSAYKERIAQAKADGNTDKVAKYEAKMKKESERLTSMYNEVKGPYFPLMRLGNWYAVGMSKELAALEDKDVKTEEDRKKIAKMRADKAHYITKSFDKRSGAVAARNEFEKTYAVARYNMAEERNTATSVLSASGLQDVEDYITSTFDKSVAGDIRDMMSELYYQSLPEHSALKREMKREGVHGEEEDMRRVFAVSALKNAHYLSRLKFSDAVKESMYAVKKTGEQSPEARDIYNEIVKRAKLSMDQTSTPWADKILTVSYFAHLGMNPAFVLTNATQPAMITLPWLAARSSTAAATSEMTKAYRVATDIISSSYRDQGWRAELNWKGKVSGPVDKMLTTLLERNLLDITIEHDLGAVAMQKHQWVGDKIKMANLPVHITELANRTITAIAAYNIAVKEKGMDHEAATDFAARAVSSTQLDYSALNAPRHMQRVFGSASLAKVTMQFRKFQQGMMWLVAKNVYDALRNKNATAEEKREARRTLFGLFTTTGVMAGSLGMPLAGSAFWVASMLTNIYGPDDEPFDAEVAYRNWLTEFFGKENAAAISKGLPAAMFDIDLSKRVGLGDIASPLPFMRQGKTVRDTFANTLLAAAGAPVATATDMAEGIKLMANGDWVKGSEEFFPLMLAKNVIRASRYQTEGMTKPNGEVVLPPSKFDASDIMWRGLGVTTERESRYYEGIQAVEKVKAAVKDTRQKLLDNYAKARMAGDDTSEEMQEIREFNSRHPQRGIRIDASTRMKSIQARKKAARERGESGIPTGKANRPYLSEADFAA